MEYEESIKAPILLSIDPGRKKCGLAVIDSGKSILHREIVPTENIKSVTNCCISRFKPAMIIMGNATWSRNILQDLENSMQIPIRVTGEKHSTERARLRYFQEYPPRGFWKLVPLTMQVPPEPCDDFAAVIIAEDFIDSSISQAEEE